MDLLLFEFGHFLFQGEVSIDAGFRKSSCINGSLDSAAGIVAVAFSAAHRMSRFRWAVFGATAAVLLAFCVTASRWAEEASSPQALLRRVVMLEQSSNRNGWGERQELSTALAIFCLVSPFAT